MNTRITAISIAVLFQVAGVSFSQTSGPNQIAEMQMAAMSKNDWVTFTSFMHPEALESFKEIFAAVISMDESGEVANELFGVSDLSLYKQKNAAEIFISFMDIINSAAPELMGIARDAKYQILGYVTEGPELAHVVYRLTVSVEGVSMSSLAVETYKQYNGQWKSLLRKEVNDIVKLIQDSIQEEE